MAKKKTKKSNSNKLVSAICALLGAVSVFLFALLPMVKNVATVLATTTVTTYSGFAMIFGGEANLAFEATTTNPITNNVSVTTGTDTMTVEFNTLAFVAFLLVCLGSVLALLSAISKSLSKNKLSCILAAALLFVGGALMLCVRESTLTALQVEYFADLYSLAYGTIVAGIVAMVSGLSTAVITIIKK